MSVFVVWIDRGHAKLFEISSEKMERKVVQERHTDHHSHRFDAIDQASHERQFFQEVTTYLADAERLLILGPGVAKYHFRSYLTDHVPALAKKLAGCETVDHPTDNQIAALALKFFNMNVGSAAKVGEPL